ncbi:HEAT repeat domain-containing protein [Actinoplanes sp. NPDC051470]|uniref:HEAT repeat domain-containing protein n=1 Tax=Actinoplanes sp. NPDC051470 TaxID=3157224 RepID=UPI003427B0C9
MFDEYRIKRWERRGDVKRLLAALSRGRRPGSVIAALGEVGDERAIGPLLGHVELAGAIAALDRIEGRGHRFFVDEFIDALRRHAWPGLSRGEFAGVAAGARRLLQRRAGADDVPALIGLMDDASMPFDLRVAAISTLASIGSTDALAHLTEHMRRGPKAMPEVYLALAGTGNRAVVADLTDFVRNDREFVPEAYLALASLRDRATVEALTGWLRRSWHVTAAEVEALAAIPGVVVDEQLWALMSELPERKGELVELIGAAALARRTPPRPPVLAALGHRSSRVRRIALEALGQAADPVHFEPIAVCAKDEDFRVRRAALRALDEFDDPRVTDILVADVTDPARCTFGAADLLSRTKHRRATGALVAWLRSAGNDRAPRLNRVTVLRCLGRLGGEEAVTTLLELFESGRPADRPHVASALGYTGDPRCVEPLLRALTEKTSAGDDTWLIVSALSDLGDRRAVPALCEILSGESKREGDGESKGEGKSDGESKGDGDAADRPERDAAAYALGRLGDVSALPALRKAGAQGSADVQLAIRRLERIEKVSAPRS